VPFELLLQLVSSFETQVASESTVVPAVHLWLVSQPPRSGSAGSKGDCLAKQVRWAGLSSLFLAQVLVRFTEPRPALGPGEEMTCIRFPTLLPCSFCHPAGLQGSCVQGCPLTVQGANRQAASPACEL